jgi:4-alpha-glucanotransferase
VPSGFRDVLKAMDIQGIGSSSRKEGKNFSSAGRLSREALACITTHYLHTLAGWWSAMKSSSPRHGMIDLRTADEQLLERAHERRRVLGLLQEHGLLPPELERVMRSEDEPSRELPHSFALALHRLVARTPSRLFVVPAEDLTANPEQVNIPGTMDEHPNWRRKLSLSIEELAAAPLFRSITEALRQERPRVS